MASQIEGSDSDDIMADCGDGLGSSGISRIGPRRGRPPVAELLHKSGPNILVVLLGAPKGRWHPELSGSSLVCGRARAALGRAVSSALDVDIEVEVGQPVQAMGLAVIRGWKFVHDGQAASMDTFHLMAAAGAAHPQRGQPHFLEHEAIATARFSGDLLTLPGHSCSAGHPPLAFAPASFVQSLSTRKICITSGGIPGHLGQDVIVAS